MIRRLPIVAVLLGVAGLLPFLGCTVGILLFPNEVPVPRLVMALIDYGAVILAFLGGVHWGFALEPAPALVEPTRPATDRRRLALGVVPSLIGWAALLIPLVASPLVAVALLIVGFAVTTLVEQQAQRRGAIPAAYMALRWILTAVVLLCLLTVLAVRIF